MRILIVLLIGMLSTCSLKKNPDNLKDHRCSSNIDDYLSFNYEFIHKTVVSEYPKDTVFDADVLITISKKDSAEYYQVDSLLCYCLALCRHERLISARFYSDCKGYEIAQEYGISDFSSDSILSKYYGNTTWITKHLIASFKINEKTEDWRNHINSEFLSTPGPRKIETKWNAEKTQRLILRE